MAACSVSFDNTPVPVENVLGEVGGGFKVVYTHQKFMIINWQTTMMKTFQPVIWTIDQLNCVNAVDWQLSNPKNIQPIMSDYFNNKPFQSCWWIYSCLNLRLSANHFGLFQLQFNQPTIWVMLYLQDAIPWSRWICVLKISQFPKRDPTFLKLLWINYRLPWISLTAADLGWVQLPEEVFERWLVGTPWRAFYSFVNHRYH